jgi:hypothetical protein
VVEEADVRETIEEMDFPGSESSLTKSPCVECRWKTRRCSGRQRRMSRDLTSQYSCKRVRVSWLKQIAFRKSLFEKKLEEAELRKLLEHGIVEPSLTPCGTSNVKVPKKKLADGTSDEFRVTTDMRAVNSVTVGEAFPTEDVGMKIDWLEKKRWFMVADVKDGYWNIRIAEEPRYLTAVKTVVDLVQSTRMTTGL